MPRETHHWQCNVCLQNHDSEEKALACERLGQPPCFPIGMAFSLASRDGEVFAILLNKITGHCNEAALVRADKKYGGVSVVHVTLACVDAEYSWERNMRPTTDAQKAEVKEVMDFLKAVWRVQGFHFVGAHEFAHTL